MTVEKRWIMFVGNRGQIADQHKSAVGYRGLRHFETREEAKADAIALLDQLEAREPNILWRAVWCYPYIDVSSGDPNEGRCYWHTAGTDGD